MLESEKEPTVVDIVSSMKRMGFAYEDIYDVLTGAGISSVEVQLLLDRVEESFEDAEIESQTTRLKKGIKKIFDEKLEEFDIEHGSKLRKFNKSLKDMNGAIERLENRIAELQGIIKESTDKK